MPDDTVETIRHAAKGHHANAHQLLLHFTVQACLRDDGGVGVVKVLEQVLLYGGDVVNRLGHHPRQFLETCETVDFQRVETGMVLVGNRGARLHLRLSLNLDIAQLATQTDNVLREVEQ